MNNITISLPRGAAKARIKATTNPARVRPLSNSGKKRWAYYFTKEEIVAGDISRFLDTFGLYAKTNHRKLRQRVLFRFVGFDTDDEVYELESVRSYVSKLLRAWPC